MIVSRVPYPLEKGDKLRAYNQLKELSKYHEIFLFALNDQKLHPNAIDELKKYCTGLYIVTLPPLTIFFNLIRAVFTHLPLQVGYFYNKDIKKIAHKKINLFKPDHIYCQLIRTSEYVKDISHIAKTIDYMDSFSKGVERRMASKSLLLKPLFNWEFKKVQQYEKNIFQYFNNRTIISDQDKNAILHHKKDEIAIIPNGVDTSYFTPVNKEKKFDLIFNGNMNYPPNIDSAVFLAKKVMPLVHKTLPNATLLISGTSPAAEVQKLENNFIKVSGWVNDIRNNYAIAKINIAPMLISIGMQNKLLEAMAMQLPCITSTLANNALGANNGTEILTADTPEEYANHITTLLSDEKKRNTLAFNGYKFVTEKYTWEKTVSRLNNIISNTKN